MYVFENHSDVMSKINKGESLTIEEAVIKLKVTKMTVIRLIQKKELIIPMIKDKKAGSRRRGY